MTLVGGEIIWMKLQACILCCLPSSQGLLVMVLGKKGDNLLFGNNFWVGPWWSF